MDNETKIVSMLENLTSTVTTLVDKVDKLEQGQIKLEQKVTKLEIVIETEIKRDIRAVAESHLTLDRKLDELKGLNEKVLVLQEDASLLKTGITAGRFS